MILQQGHILLISLQEYEYEVKSIQQNLSLRLGEKFSQFEIKRAYFQCF